jgi:hypothetical protein
MKKNLRIGAFALITIAVLAVAGCPGSSNPGQSGEKRILSFTVTVGGQTAQGDIDEPNRRITLTLPAGTDVTALAPVVAVSDKAAVVPASGAEQDFTNPVQYTVTAEDGSSQVYTVLIVPETPQEALDLAATAKAGVQAAASAAEAPEGTEWVPQAAMDAFTAAIDAAKAVAGKDAPAQAEVDEAETTLKSATAAFNGEKKEGAKPGKSGLTLIDPFTEPEGASIGDSFTIYRPPTLFNAEQTVTLSGDEYTDIKWYVDNLLVQDTGDATLNIRARNFSQGRHYLSVEFIKDGKPYDIGLVFVVGG